MSFAVLGIVAMVWYRSYKRQHPDGSEQPTLSQRGMQYVGNDYLLVEAIEQGSGKVRIGDATVWKVSGADAPAGTKVG
ncbi:MAG: NfeD family protein [Steroidobacteraceae bacterium]